MATEVTLAHHVEKAVDNTSDVDCVAYQAIILDSVVCQSPRHTRQANEIHALTIRFLNTQYCVTGRNRPNRIRFIKMVVISRLYSGPMPLNSGFDKRFVEMRWSRCNNHAYHVELHSNIKYPLANNHKKLLVKIKTIAVA